MTVPLRVICLVLILGAALAVPLVPLVTAQDADVGETRYAEDYERLQAVAAVKSPLERAQRLTALYKERPAMDPRLTAYADGLFTENMDALLKQGNSIAVRGLAERAVAARPKFGEAYLYLGVAYKNESRFDDAMKAFAKCHLIENRFQKRAKTQLDIAYRARNKGSLIGEEKVIEAAKVELK